MEVQFKKLHPNAVLPFYGTEGAAGMDITATSKSYDKFGNAVYGTGLAMALPPNYVCLIFPRSSNSKKDLILSNAVGLLDEDYRGELFLKFKPINKFVPDDDGFTDENGNEYYSPCTYNPDTIEYSIGERVGQILILPYPKIKAKLVDELSATVRGEGAFGSTGK